jgi:hypothetical protein
MSSGKHCSICNRLLDQSNDPGSLDCGGDCWACVKKFEAPPLKRLMVTPGGHHNPHEECPDCRGVCSPLNNEHYKDGFLK